MTWLDDHKFQPIKDSPEWCSICFGASDDPLHQPDFVPEEFPKLASMKPKARDYWQRRYIQCRQHAYLHQFDGYTQWQMHCYIQNDGTHRSALDCVCRSASPLDCPIDAHRIPWVLDNPDFEELPNVKTRRQPRNVSRYVELQARA